MSTDPEALGSLLCVWAHPDDETYLSAGLMAAASRAGRQAVCVTATRGEAGSTDLERWPLETLASVREQELKEALAILGTGGVGIEHRWLDYLDGECDKVDENEAVAKVSEIIDDVRPDSVLTFGPDGMTGHTDHKAVCEWTTQAFRSVSPPGAKLYYATTTQEWLDAVMPVFGPFDVFFAGLPSVTAPDDLAIDFELDDELMALKIKAVRAQVSQSEAMFEGIGESFFVTSNGREMYVLAVEA
ncbi:MAG: N-acetyl-D-myo-inositol-2-amino-2-deoxy-alpha-D-glucopyranoside deacetylase [Actinomycetota bacterium]|jgi:LmbE family N-acetylglucosaminyl deacetylase|nr:N-acetyl-D-myo-inositol-2-amino-2-deoxy-alpha-D-glucopyranoside deacetylase [Actinomycetota bacterium]